MSGITTPNFAGVYQAINPSNEWERPAEEEVEDDVEGEQETLPDPDHEPGDHDVATSLGPSNGENGLGGTSSNEEQMSQLQSTLLNASKGVTEGTDNEYKRFTIKFIHCRQDIYNTTHSEN